MAWMMSGGILTLTVGSRPVAGRRRRWFRFRRWRRWLRRRRRLRFHCGRGFRRRRVIRREPRGGRNGLLCGHNATRLPVEPDARRAFRQGAQISATKTLRSAFVVLVSAIMVGLLVLSRRELAAFLPVLARTSRSSLPRLRDAHSW